MVEIEGVTKYYGDLKAVSNISFSVKKGEIVGFLGPNGAGKTTTLRMITGFLLPTEGNVYIDGDSILQKPLLTKSKIGYLPETTPLYDEMKVYEYLEFIAHIRGIKETKEAIKNACEQCGIIDVLSKEVGTLSKGYKQRVGIAQAILHQPDILIFDEPTEGLDPNQVMGVRELIKRLGEEKTVILSTHILSEVEATCERVIIINKGEIITDERKENLGRLSREKNVIIMGIKTNKDIESTKTIISKMDGVTGITGKSLDNKHIELEITAENDIREELFDIALKEELSIYELHLERKKLEDIFRELTVEEK